ncbi:BTAD domain-containing putative transcriptional regulator [Kitasatospora xanthocidica]|uniref:BTAD domain-containing putative transcriptional regulator n=1 Tax=Kitasatospora xanthocidica TaxID=83382 RepID=UPI0036E2CA09
MSHRPATRRTNLLADLLRALASLVALLALLVALPIGLLIATRALLPVGLTNIGSASDLLTRQDTGGLALLVLAAVGWTGWAQFAISVLLEIPAQLRGRTAPKLRIPGFRVSQRAAAGLVSGILILLPTAGGAFAATATPAPATPVRAAATAAAVPQQATAPAAADQTRTSTGTGTQRIYTVRDTSPADSLWSIAESQLGDGSLWREIATLNEGRTMPDGAVFHAARDIQPGWQLLLPGRPQAPANTEADHGTVTVQPGDTLSRIAQRELGDADRYPDIAAANTGHKMTDGDTFTNPNVIHPGWTLTIPQPQTAPPPATSTPHQDTQPPATAPKPSASTAPTPAPSNAATAVTPPPTSAAATPTAQPTPQTSTAPTQPPAAAPVAAAAAGSSVDLAAIASWGGLAAAGILSALAARRARQQRNRRRGEQIRMPAAAPTPAKSTADPVEAAAADLAAYEQQLRASEDPAGAVLIDRALRTVAAALAAADRPLPTLAAVRLGPDTLDLHLEEPAPAVRPFTNGAEPTHWTCPTTGADLLTASEARNVCAPYPALATLGRTPDGATILADLENLGVLLVRPDHAHPLLRALTVELITAPWRDDLGVILTGLGTGLAALDDGYGRIQLTDQTDEALDNLTSWNTTVRSALSDSDTPSILHARVSSPTPDAWSPRIAIIGSPLSTQHTTTIDGLLANPACTAVIAAADTDLMPAATRMPGPDGGPLTVGPLALDHLVPPHVTDTDYEALLALLDITDTLAEPAEAEHPHAPDTAAATEPARETATTQPARLPDGDDIDIPEAAGPVLRLLGPVTLTGTESTVMPAAEARMTEVAAWIALHPGSPIATLTTDLSPADPSATTASGQVSGLRRWLGNNADGQPRVTIDTGSGMELRDVTVDWHLFGELSSQGTSKSLTRALELVDGRPFEDVPPRRYTWAEAYRQQMIAAIVDTAARLAEHRLATGDHSGAVAAAEFGIRAEPAAEELYRLAIQGAHQARDREAVEQYADRLDAVLQKLGVEMQPKTTEILRNALALDTYAGSTS